MTYLLKNLHRTMEKTVPWLARYWYRIRFACRPLRTFTIVIRRIQMFFWRARNGYGLKENLVRTFAPFITGGRGIDRNVAWFERWGVEM